MYAAVTHKAFHEPLVQRGKEVLLSEIAIFAEGPEIFIDRPSAPAARNSVVHVKAHAVLFNSCAALLTTLTCSMKDLRAQF